MKASSIFGLILRLIGLFFLYQATTLGVNVVSHLIHGPVSIGGIKLSSSRLDEVIGYALAAVWFVKGAPPFSDWAYPAAEEKKPAE